MKRKILISLIIFAITFSFSIMDAYAIEVVPYFIGGGYDTGMKWHAQGKGSPNFHGAYTDYVKAIKVNGVEYPIFCTDPGLSLRSGTKYSCTPTQDPGLAYILDMATGAQKNTALYSKIQLALRFYAVMHNELYAGQLSDMKAAVVRYVQMSELGMTDVTLAACPECVAANAVNPSDYLEGNEGLIQEALSIVRAAEAARKSGGKVNGPSTEGVLAFKKTTNTKNLIVYNVTSTAEIDKLKFVCEGCTISGADDNWNKTSGTLTVIPPADCKEFKIKAYFAPSGYYLCTTSGPSKQFTVTKFEEEESSTAAAGGKGDKIDTSGEPSQIWTDAAAGCEECCTLGPEIEPNHIEGNVSNCCYDNTHSEAKEYELNDLFCKETKLNVNHYWKKCKNEPYIDSKMTGDLNDYCRIYCTERVSVDIPGAITATSGRYFDLTTTAQGTKSPYVEGYKRCRTIIDYDKWHKDYMTAVETEVENYNKFQENEAYKLMYDDSIAASFATTETVTVTCTLQTRTASASCSYSGGTDTATATSKSGGSNPTKSFTLSYTRYPFTTLAMYPRPWYQVQLDEKRENDATHKHIGVFLEDDKKNYETKHGDWSAWDIRDQITEINNYLNEWNNKEIEGTSDKDSCSHCSCSAETGNSYWTCSRNTAEAESRQENVPEVRNAYDAKAKNANTTYNGAADTAKDLEDKIDKCDLYFEKYEGTDAQANFQFAPNFQGMEYSQVYLNDYGSLIEDKQLIVFDNTPGCEITGPILGPDAIDGLVEPQYSDSLHYSTGKEQMEDFRNSKLVWKNSRTGFAEYRHELYEADKKFVQDAKYKAVCSWDEPENTKYTLVPKGQVIQSTVNTTLNNRQYSIFLTTLDGTYDTRWLLNRLGTNGKFDKFFAENGQTCSTKQNAYEDGLFHCGIHVEHEIVYTGRCNGEKTTISKEECDPNKGPDPVLNFKIADPKNLFPSCSGDSCDYAYNWFKGNNGPETLNAIQRDGAKDSTYSPSHLSYSVTLSPKDMRQIKGYNTYREEDKRGGYSDFSLICSCPEEPEECNEVGGTQTCKRSRSCVKCTSVFLTKLYQGRVEYGGSSYSVTGGNGNIQTVRDTKVHWSGV